MGNATNRWLDKLAAHDKANGGTGTDYKLAQLLDLPAQRVSRYRRGADKAMGDDVAAALAELLGVHPMIVIADLHSEQSRDLREQRVWDQVAKHFGKKAAVVGAVILAASGLGAPATSSANWGAGSPSPVGSGSPSPSVYYVKRPQHRRRRKNRPHFRPGRVVTLAALSEVTATSRARGVH